MKKLKIIKEDGRYIIYYYKIPRKACKKAAKR